MRETAGDGEGRRGTVRGAGCHHTYSSQPPMTTILPMLPL